MSRSCSSESTNNTSDDLRSICNGCDKQDCNSKDCRITKITRVECCPPHQRYDPGVSCFTSVITPLSNLTPLYSGCTGSVEFKMRRKNKTVILQWEPFTGILASSGVSYLTVVQSICNTPPYPVTKSMYLEYKSQGRNTHIIIDPSTKKW